MKNPTDFPEERFFKTKNNIHKLFDKIGYFMI